MPSCAGYEKAKEFFTALGLSFYGTMVVILILSRTVVISYAKRARIICSLRGCYLACFIRRKLALMATIMVLTVIKTAPAAGLNKIPAL